MEFNSKTLDLGYRYALAHTNLSLETITLISGAMSLFDPSRNSSFIVENVEVTMESRKPVAEDFKMSEKSYVVSDYSLVSTVKAFVDGECVFIYECVGKHGTPLVWAQQFIASKTRNEVSEQVDTALGARASNSQAS